MPSSGFEQPGLRKQTQSLGFPGCSDVETEPSYTRTAIALENNQLVVTWPSHTLQSRRFALPRTSRMPLTCIRMAKHVKVASKVGQTASRIRLVRDGGQNFRKRDCPTQSGTVGQSEQVNFKVRQSNIQLVRKSIMSHFHFLRATGWVGRVPPGIKEFLNLPFLVLKARHPVIQESICVVRCELN